MKRTVTHYPEETKKNVVAAVRSGISQNSIARRLGIPSTTVNQWMRSQKYAGIASAAQNVMEALPADPNAKDGYTPQRMVKLSASQLSLSEQSTKMRISFGKLTFESESFTSDSIAMIIRALGEADVL